jgi:cell division protease FtsH
MDKLENLARALLERETLTGEEIDRAINGELTRSDDEPPASSGSSKGGEEKREGKKGLGGFGLNPQLEA